MLKNLVWLRKNNEKPVLVKYHIDAFGDKRATHGYYDYVLKSDGAIKGEYRHIGGVWKIYKGKTLWQMLRNICDEENKEEKENR